MELGGKSVLVTGGARRVGRAIVLELARRGARVGIHYASSVNEAGELATQVRELGAEVAVFGADLAVPAEIEVLAEAVTKRFDGLDLLVNSAALYFRTPVGSVTPADFDRLYKLNLRAPFLLSQALAPALRRHPPGRIIMITDVGGVRPWPGFLPYGATKAGLIHLVHGLAKALAPDVLVNGVSPGTVLPPEDLDERVLEAEVTRTLVGRLGTPDEIARAVAFIAESEFMTGEVITVDGGKSWR